MYKEVAAHKHAKANAIRSPFVHRLKRILKGNRRWSANPQKHLLFTWIHRVLRRSGKFDTTLDIACGNVAFYPFVKSKKYIGVDMNKASIDFARDVYPDAEVLLMFMEEIDPKAVRGDLVMCIQTIGVNSYYETKNTISNIKMLRDCTRPGGTLMFDIGPLVLDQEDALIKELEGQFDKISIRKYGSFDNGINVLVSGPLALLMDLIPPLRTAMKNDRRFYVCEGRK